MIDQDELFKVLEQHRDDAVVFAVFRAARHWLDVSKNPKRDMPIGTLGFPFVMGKASSFALGISLAQPDVKFFLLDGDGSVLMNLGSLITIADKAPKNLYHFVIENGVYATTGGQDLPGRGTSSLERMGKASGYAHTHRFEDLESFSNGIGDILAEEGPTLICVDVIPDIMQAEEHAAPPPAPPDPAVPPVNTRQVILNNLRSEFGLIK